MAGGKIISCASFLRMGCIEGTKQNIVHILVQLVLKLKKKNSGKLSFKLFCGNFFSTLNNIYAPYKSPCLFILGR